MVISGTKKTAWQLPILQHKCTLQKLMSDIMIAMSVLIIIALLDLLSVLLLITAYKKLF